MEFQSASSLVVSPIWRKVSWRFLFILLVASLFLIISVFFLFDQDRKTNLSTNLPVTMSNLPAGNVLNDRIFFLLNAASDSKNQSEKLTDYIKAYQMLVIIYQSTSDSKVRGEITKLNGFLKAKFSGDSRVNLLTVPCLEKSCGFAPTEDLLNLESEISQLKEISEEEKKVLFYNLRVGEQAASEKNTELEFNSLSSVFFGLKSQKVQSEAIKPIEGNLLDIMKRLSPELFKIQKGLTI